MPGFKDPIEQNPFLYSLAALVLEPSHRRNIVLELRYCLYLLDRQIVKKCQEFLNTSPDESSTTYQSARSYLGNNYTRRPLYVAAHALDYVLANPNFFKEFYIFLVVCIQFTDVAKKYIAPYTLEPVFRNFFKSSGSISFYSRFQTFMPNAKIMQSVDKFIMDEFSLFLIAINRGARDVMTYSSR